MFRLPNIDFCRPCKYGCGAVVGFNDEIRSSDGKSRIPIDPRTGLAHQCKIISLQDSSQANKTYAIKEQGE